MPDRRPSGSDGQPNFFTEVARPTRFERVGRLMAFSSMMGRWRNRLSSGTKPHFPAVAEMMGFGLGSSKMLCLSMEIDWLPLRHIPFVSGPDT